MGPSVGHLECDMENALTIRSQSNPFEPKYMVAEVQLKPSSPLAEYCLPFEREYGNGENLIVVLNGREIEPMQRAVIVPRVGDQIVIKPKVQGGVLRIFAFIALMVVAVIGAPYLGAFLENALTINALTTTQIAMLAGSAIVLGGGILLNVLLPPPSPSVPDQTSSYNWDGPQMTAKAGIPVAKGYGTFRCGGNVIA